MKQLGAFLHHQLQNPLRILFVCIAFSTLGLVFHGGLLDLYSMHRDRQRLLDQMVAVKAEIIDLDLKLKQAKDPSYVERQALDRYELADENDLVFVFSED